MTVERLNKYLKNTYLSVSIDGNSYVLKDAAYPEGQQLQGFYSDLGSLIETVLEYCTLVRKEQ